MISNVDIPVFSVHIYFVDGP